MLKADQICSRHRPYWALAGRIGEASLPGPSGTSPLDDPEADPFQFHEGMLLESQGGAGEEEAYEEGTAADHAQLPPAYRAAAKFSGRRPGAVFKLGSEGLG